MTEITITHGDKSMIFRILDRDNVFFNNKKLIFKCENRAMGDYILYKHKSTGKQSKIDYKVNIDEYANYEICLKISVNTILKFSWNGDHIYIHKYVSPNNIITHIKVQSELPIRDMKELIKMYVTEHNIEHNIENDVMNISIKDPSYHINQYCKKYGMDNVEQSSFIVPLEKIVTNLDQELTEKNSLIAKLQAELALVRSELSDDIIRKVQDYL